MRALLIGFLGIMVLLTTSLTCSKKETVKTAQKPPASTSTSETKVHTAPAMKDKAQETTAPKEIRLSRDPFRRYVAGSEAPSGPRGYSELSQIPLSDFRYVGILTSESENLALLEDRQGYGHTVRVGTLIGRNSGEVTEINDREIIVKEIKNDASGRSSIKYVRLLFSSKR